MYRWLRLTHFVEIDLVEEYLSQEDQELSVMSSMLDEVQSSPVHNQLEMSDYGSDDEDYERLLMNAVQKMEQQPLSSLNSEPTQEHHDMDMTVG